MTDVHRASEPVMAGVDGSESALRAVRWAAHEAHRRRVPLRLVTAIGWLPEPAGPDDAHGANYRAVLTADAGERVAAAADEATAVAPGLEIIRAVLPGYPIPRLLTEARAAQLAVVGDRGLGGFSGLLVGSVAIALAAHAACPVVVVRGTDPDTRDAAAPVVVGVDGSPVSEAALAFAYDAAAARGVPLVAVHTWQDAFVDATVAPLLDWEAIETDEQLVLAERLAGWAGTYPDVAVERVVARDRPAHALVERSREAQLLVVGSRGRGGFSGLVLGSVSQALLHHAHCPVAVVRSGVGPA